MEKMTKVKAISFFKSKYALSTLNSSLATRNQTIPVYWSNARFRLLEFDWYLILHDDLNRILYLFYIPMNSIKKDQMVARDSERMALEIYYNDPTYTDRKSGFFFKEFLIDKVQY